MSVRYFFAPKGLFSSHPRISPEEKAYKIQAAIKEKGNRGWRFLLCEVPLYPAGSTYNGGGP